MKITKKIVSLSCSLMLLFILYTPSGLALSNNSVTFSSVHYASSFSSGTWNYYSQLSTEQKYIYDQLKAINPTSGDLTITLYKSLSYTSSSYQPTTSEQSTAQQDLSNLLQPAMDAMLKDYPEIFWLKFGNDGCSYGWTWEQPTRSGSRYVHTIRKVTFSQVLIDDYASSASSLASSLQSMISSFSVTGSTRYQKVKSIHDGLCHRLTYDYACSSTSFDPYGTLKYNTAVCEGYAEAFKLLCDREDIPCTLIAGEGRTSASSSGENHMWNAVQMEDGNWYGVDVTWDDQKTIYYDFFLVGSDTKDTYFSGMKFSDSHVENGNFSGDPSSKTFAYPTLSLTAYKVPFGSTSGSTTTSVSGTTAPKPHVTAPQSTKKTAAAVIATSGPTKATSAKTSSAKTTANKTTGKPAAQSSEAGTLAAQADKQPSASVNAAGGISAAASDIDKTLKAGTLPSELLYGVLMLICLIVLVGAVCIILMLKRKDSKKLSDTADDNRDISSDNNKNMSYYKYYSDYTHNHHDDQ